jgi:hypothetical protein
MHMTNEDLMIMYRDFNRKYFSNALPHDLVVEYGRLKGFFGITECYKNRPLYVILDWDLRKSRVHSAMTLLHELVHVENPEWYGHGPRFHKRMLKLAKEKAFNSWW